MDLLKKFWPLSFKVSKDKVLNFFICFIIYVIICFVLQLLSNALASVSVLGTVMCLIYYVVDVYSVIGVVLCVCQLFGVFESLGKKNDE